MTWAPERAKTLGESDVLDGGEVLPGFTVKVAEVFAEDLAPND
jgi:hypothetical protein